MNVTLGYVGSRGTCGGFVRYGTYECRGVIVVKIWAYFLENTSAFYYIDNTPLFREIQENDIGEESVFVDEIAGKQVELKKLLEVMEKGDTVLIRSVADLGKSGAEIIDVLQRIERKGVDVASVTEDWYDYQRMFPCMKRVVGIIGELAERKRKLGMERARAEGRLGRKANTEKKEHIRKLRGVGLAPKEICDIVGVSRSTYYRCG